MDKYNRRLKHSWTVVGGTCRTTSDFVSPGIKLYKAAQEPKEIYLVPGAGHNDVSLMAGNQYIQTIASFLKSKI